MREVLYLAGGVAIGVVLAMRLRPASSARCCQQLEQLVRADVRKRCGPLGGLCEGVGDVLGLFDNASPLLDLGGITS